MNSALKLVLRQQSAYSNLTLLRRGLHAFSISPSSSFLTRTSIRQQSRCLSEVFFTPKHEYIMMEKDNIGKVGISDYAQEKLGDVVYVQLPEIGREVEKDEEVAAVESVKAASEIYSPVSGNIVEVNEGLESDSGLINKSAMDQGWIYKVTISSRDELNALMTESAYEKFLKDESEDDE